MTIYIIKTRVFGDHVCFFVSDEPYARLVCSVLNRRIGFKAYYYESIDQFYDPWLTL